MTHDVTKDHTATASRQLARSLLAEALICLGAQAVATEDAQCLPGRPGSSTEHPVVWDGATIRAAIQAFQAREGRPPTRSEWRQAQRHQLPSRDTVTQVYGTLEAAYTASGLALPASRRGLGRWRARE